MLLWIIILFIVIGAVSKNNDSSHRINTAEEERLNNAAPVQTLPVRVAGRRMIQHNAQTAFADYYLRFEAPDGSSREMKVDQTTYYTYQDGITGTLTYQRKRFLGFVPLYQDYAAQADSIDPELFARNYPGQTQPVQGYPAQPESGYPPQYQQPYQQPFPQDYSDQTPLY